MIWIDELNSLEIKSEKLKNSKLKEFVKTNLFLNNIPYEKSYKIYTNYIKQIASYQILVFKENFQQIFLECFSVYEDLDDSFTLFYCDDFFIIYYEKRPYYFQKSSYKLDEKEIKKYIKNRLDIDIKNVVFVSDDKLESLKQEFLKSKKSFTLVDINSSKDRFMSFYILYIVLLVCLSGYYVYLSNKKELQVSKVSVKPKQIQYKFDFFDKKYSVLLQNLRKYEITLDELKYEKRGLSLKLLAKNKKVFYDFATLYNRADIKSITFLSEKKIYECEVSMRSF